MTKIQKFTIGVAPYARLFRMLNLGGQIVDAVLALRLKALPEDFFAEVSMQADHNGYRLIGQKGRNSLAFNDQSITFTKDFYESDDSFDFNKMVEQFRTIWGAVNSVLHLADARRVGIVAESKYEVPSKATSAWMRNKLSPAFASDLHAEKFQLRFEDRALAADGLAPDPKKADFINTIYQIYDGELDTEHSAPGYMYSTIDVQRYFTPVIAGKDVVDEAVKLKKHFDLALKRLDTQLQQLGASHAKK